MANVPRDWPVYLLVQDVEAAAQKVGELGGSLLVPVTSAGEVGKFCVVQDPRVPLSASSSTLAQYHRHLAISLDSEP